MSQTTTATVTPSTPSTSSISIRVPAAKATLMNYLPTLSLSTMRNAMFYAYVALIGVAALRGFWVGMHKWWNWKNTRTKKTLISRLDFLEDTVNMIRDSTYFLGYLGFSAIFNIFVAGTFPVSVPAILLLFNDNKRAVTDGKEVVTEGKNTTN